MPQNGLCTDSNCLKEIKPLYECHCCLRLICFNHLTEHVEIQKQMKEKFHFLVKELRTKTESIQLSIENRLSIIERETKFIEREKKFIEQANHLLDGQIYPINQIEQILEEFNQLIEANHSKETIVKVESSLLDETNDLSTSQYLNEIDKLSLEMVSSESKSSLCFDLTEDLGETENDITTEEIEHPMCIDDHFVKNLSHNQNDSYFQNYESLSSCSGCCPLTFNGAYGLSESKHSIRLCSNKKQRSVYLYDHFKNKHQLTAANARRLVEAIAKNQKPRKTKLFNDNEDIIDPSRKIECPFRKGINHLFDSHKKTSIIRVPCHCQSVPGRGLKQHLKRYHHVSEDLATKFTQHYSTQNNDLSPS